jgi:hypothetical protein
MNFIDAIKERARKDLKTVILPEAEDTRVLQATEKITKEGFFLAIKMAVRLSFLIVGSSIMTLTTTPNHLTDGLESLLNPLKKIKVPVHEVAMMMSIALRFIPILMEETDKIMKAQIARGADFESGNLIQKAKAMALDVSWGLTAFGIKPPLHVAYVFPLIGFTKIWCLFCTKIQQGRGNVEKCTKKRGICPVIAQIIR